MIRSTQTWNHVFGAVWCGDTGLKQHLGCCIYFSILTMSPLSGSVTDSIKSDEPVLTYCPGSNGPQQGKMT